jgi:hypothetical protein
MRRRIELDHVVPVDELRIALHDNRQRRLVLEAEPGAAVGQRVGGHRGRSVERLPHAAADVAIPAAGAALRIDPGGFPQPQFERVGTAAVAARNECCLRLGDRGEPGHRVVAALDVGGVGIRSDHDEVVPGDLAAADAVPLPNEFLLGLGVMNQHEIGVAAPRGVERLPGAQRQHMHGDAAGLGKPRQDRRQQPGIVDRGRRGEGDRRRFGPSRW